jgi:uncharacterized protein YuzE
MVGMTYDNDGDALYIRFTDETVSRTVEVDSGTLVDLDDSGELIGVEVLRPARAWPLQEVLTRFPAPAEDRALLEALFLRAHGAPRLALFSPAGQDIVATEVEAEVLSA